MAEPNNTGNGLLIAREIALDDLIVTEANARRQDITADVDQLAQNIAQIGLQQPIVVQPRGDKYEILIGQRRYLAYKQLGKATIPAFVRTQPLDPIDAKAVSFSENIQRRDLTPRDKSDVCVYLRDRLGGIRAVAQRLGITEQTVRKWIGYAEVPEPLKQLVEQNLVTRPTASRIASLVLDEELAVSVARKFAEINPQGPARERLFTALEELPNEPVDRVVERAERLQTRRQIVFVLPETWDIRMAQIARRLQRDPSEIAKDATISWLEQQQL